MSFWECEKCGGKPGITWCCTDKAVTQSTDQERAQALAEKYGATSYRNRADTQHPAYGFTTTQLAALIAEVEQAARRAPAVPAVPAQKGDYLDGVNIPRLREALTFLGRDNGVGEGEVANKLSEYVNSITRAVLACKELLRQGAQAAPVQLAEPAANAEGGMVVWNRRLGIPPIEAKLYTEHQVRQLLAAQEQSHGKQT